LADAVRPRRTLLARDGTAFERALMARYQHLPIYAEAYRLALHVEQQVQGFSNKHRAAIGADLRHATQAILRLIVRANSEADRRLTLSTLSAQVEEFLILARLSKDLKAFSGLSAYEQCANLACSLGRQTEGWLRSVKGPRPDV